MRQEGRGAGALDLCDSVFKARDSFLDLNVSYICALPDPGDDLQNCCARNLHRIRIVLEVGGEFVHVLP